MRAGNSSTPAVGTTREASDAIIERCVELLASGGIVAIKGLGGFHLACDAANEQAVAELRRRKRRSNKPLAVMVRSLADTERLCHIDDAERDRSPAVSAPSCCCAGALFSEDNGGSPDIPRPRAICRTTCPELGVMLPYTPLQHLLFCRGRSLRYVRARHDQRKPERRTHPGPTTTLPGEHLVAAGIADALLGNDRAILSRYDDSVVRAWSDSAAMPVRRGHERYAPQPLPLPALDGVPSCVLACGPQLKATIALTREGDERRGQPVLCRSISAMLKRRDLRCMERRAHIGRPL